MSSATPDATRGASDRSSPADRVWAIRDGWLPLERTLVMGIVNVTPDSFSDGGTFATAREAVAAGLLMVDQGADILDVGGESTRPGASPVPAAEEIDRVVPVIEPLAAAGAVVSVDTMKPEVAEVAIAAGARIVNDVFGLRAQGMAELCAGTGVGVVIMHMAGTPRTMQADPRYDDVVLDVAGFLRERIDAALRAGVAGEAIVVDPGIGFGKTSTHNLELLGGLGTLRSLGYPVMVGTSRKSFLGAITGRELDERDVASAVSAALAVTAGAAVVRVHNVPFGRDAVRVADAMVRRRE